MIMAAACYPEEQFKVQEQLDNLVGGHRSAFYAASVQVSLVDMESAPTFEDEAVLTRVTAFVLEVYRW
jgi:hypothetical protein